MARDELLTLEGLIDEIMPDDRFRVPLENGASITAYTAGRMRRGRIRSVVGDQMRDEMSPMISKRAGSPIARGVWLQHR